MAAQLSCSIRKGREPGEEGWGRTGLSQSEVSSAGALPQVPQLWHLLSWNWAMDKLVGLVWDTMVPARVCLNIDVSQKKGLWDAGWVSMMRKQGFSALRHGTTYPHEWASRAVVSPAKCLSCLGATTGSPAAGEHPHGLFHLNRSEGHTKIVRGLMLTMGGCSWDQRTCRWMQCSYFLSSVSINSARVKVINDILGFLTLVHLIFIFLDLCLSFP